jgi:cytidine deaminase
MQQMNIEEVYRKQPQSEIADLIRLACEAQSRSYSPYSHFATGAALMAKDGRIFQGCNIENAAYSPTICAERAAFASAVSMGEREFTQIAIVGGYPGQKGDYCPPCGVCRQVMAEFCDPKQFRIILARDVQDYKIYRLEELLPEGFGPANL